MVFFVPFVAVCIGAVLIALIKRTSPGVEWERMGSEERLTPGDDACDMTEERFRIFLIDFFQEKGFRPVRLYEESAGVFIMVMENPQPVFGGKQVVKCIRQHEQNHIASKEVARFREMVRSEPGARGLMFSTLPFTIEAQEIGRDLGIELVGPSLLRRIVATGQAAPTPADETDPAILPSGEPWRPEVSEGNSDPVA